MTTNILVASQLKKRNLSKKENVNNLVRILARFGNIPKINGVTIIPSKKEPELFKIIPGKSIIIGSTYLKNPILALVYLRYAIEWQIWFKALNQDKLATLLCDFAALRVTRMFFNLLPKQDKLQLEVANYILKDFITEKETSETGFLNINNELLEKLASFHGYSSSKENLKKYWISIVKSLAKPTELLLMSGGDLRLQIDEEELLNKYGCRPFPRPEAFTFASSTATSVSNYAFNKTEKARTDLIAASLSKGKIEASFDFSELLKSDLKRVLKLKKDCEIIFSASGTDSALQIAGITQIVTKNKITHVLVGSDETGSGVSAALKGRHFETTTALGLPIKKGEQIEGFRDVEVVEIPFRSNKGILKTAIELDDEVFEAITKANNLGKYLVLHVMDQSKLGYQAPSETLIDKLNKMDGLSLQIIVDGSQMRLDPKDINDYIKKGYIITITGSKYYTGPPYAGALIIPKTVSEKKEFKEGILPKGLSNYYNHSDWPVSWTCSKDLSNGFNYGATMRWNAAIAEMKRYYKIPILYRNLGIEMFCNYVEESIMEAPFLEQLFDKNFKIHVNDNEDISLRNIRTIFPFFIKKDNNVLNEENVKKLYLLLNADLSKYFQNASIETLRVASQKCHIGQAVKVLHKSNVQSAILRISLGARVISDSWKDRDVSIFFSSIEDQMNQVTIIIKKIELIVKHPQLLKT